MLRGVEGWWEGCAGQLAHSSGLVVHYSERQMCVIAEEWTGQTISDITGICIILR